MISRKLITSSQTASKCLSLYATDWKTLGVFPFYLDIQIFDLIDLSGIAAL